MLRALLIIPLLVCALPGWALAAVEAQPENFLSDPDSGLKRLPVEVVSADGGPSEWVLVEVAAEQIPEPEAAVLVLLAGLLMLRRQRA